MRRMFKALFAFAAASSLVVPALVSADILKRVPEHRTRAARLHTSHDFNDPDTVFIGHILDATFTAPNLTGINTMPAGGYGPYKVGRGPNRVKKISGVEGSNGTWDFDHFQADEKDSLMGWWPIARPAQRGSTTLQDWKRAHQALDYGNNVNYVINEGGPVDANGNKRTFGIVGLWHRDPGNAAYIASDTLPTSHNVQPPLWSTTEVGGAGSTGSAWCGLRSHGDLKVRDRVDLGGTGNYINSSMLEYQGGAAYSEIGSTQPDATDHNFPGYNSQLDQMLYRDVTLNESQGLNISFRFSSNMSTSKAPGTADNPAGRMVGWFDKDPVSPAMDVGYNNPTSDGNFISANEAGITAGAPCDSFMIYVGAPVNDNNVYFSAPLFVNGVEITTVYDKKRRWFTEVIRAGYGDPINGCVGGQGPCVGSGRPNGYKEIASFAGIRAAATITCNFGVAYPTILKKIKDADGNTSNGGTVRIVFRVKTNRGYDDENFGVQGFNSGTRGAVILDNVFVNNWAAAEGNFENTEPGQLGVIDNRTSVAATAAWKSTGKPPSVYWHVHDISSLTITDPCGAPLGAGRRCNLNGKVLTSGDHDVAAEKTSGVFNTNITDRQKWVTSPTINLVASGNGIGNYNAMGIDQDIAKPESDYLYYMDFYNAQNVSPTSFTGNFFSFGFQSYPARQVNGNICWGETQTSKFVFSYGSKFCISGVYDGAIGEGYLKTTNTTNVPDSIRMYIQEASVCYNFAGVFTAALCGQTAPEYNGAYWDNISLAITDGAAPPALSIDFQTLFNDAFPANGNDALIPAGFDTCAAQIRNGLQLMATGLGLTRPAVSGDSTVLTANDPGGADTRVDMIFRIKPGVGNYFIVGNRASGVAKRADGGATAGSPPARAVATAGDGSFWGEYMADPGTFSKGNHNGGLSWDENTWNSARMDTAEVGLFPPGPTNLIAGRYCTQYHESDPHYTTLGVAKFRCVAQNPAGPYDNSNIKCDGTGQGQYAGAGGMAASENGLPFGQTYEYTKIIPDGLLTPGAHVEYFFRKSDAASGGTTNVHLAADTTIVVNQAAVNTFDGDFHRWHEFSILPDRWKSNEWAAGDQDASAPACMLYLDFADRRGDEGVWVGIADTIGATAGAYVGGVPTGRWGAHNGWHARGDQDITVDISTDPSIAVYAHRGQPGTIWDMYGVKAIESSTTSTGFAGRTTTDPVGDLVGKKNLISPTGLMLRNYYRVLMILTGDILADIGPYPDRGENDLGTLQDFVLGGPGSQRPRAVWIMGRDFVEGQVTSGPTAHPTFPTTFFGAGLVDGNYRVFSGNPNDVLDLTTFAPHATSPAQTYGVFDPCSAIRNDVLSESGSGFTATKALAYPNFGAHLNNYASIYAASTYGVDNSHPYVSLVDGFRITSLGSQGTLQTRGANLYFWDTITNIFGSFNCVLSAGQPVGVGDIPGGTNFLALRSENPVRNQMAHIAFGITRKEKVELNVYDVSGRLVKTLANREFEAGSHDLFWDGSNNDGQLVSRGVYFYQLRTPSFVSQKKLAVLKN